MKMFVNPSEVFLHRDFVDFRKAINGLPALVEDELNRDAYTRALFVFCNKAKDKLKILYWDNEVFMKPLNISKFMLQRNKMKIMQISLKMQNE